MNVYDLIFKKRNGGELSEVELRFFVKGVTDGSIPSEQITAWLMAAFLRGLSAKEMTALTRGMTDSGDRLDLSAVPGPTVDKHSTGGVGDGTSLVLAPLIASVGATVPMMSGRALGHTGGTLDKLEAIPGFRVSLSETEFKKQLKAVGCAIIGQTDRVAPADKKLYALRDVTATVDSIPLIAASIMSKKLAEGTRSLLLDVKTGSGAFMTKKKDSMALARAMVAIGKGAGVKTMALITDMSRPLGRVAGNALEVRQAIETLKGEGPPDFHEMVLTLGSWMLVLSGKTRRPEDARKLLEVVLSNGKALNKLRDMIAAQGGNPRVLDDPEKLLPLAPVRKEVASDRSGFVLEMDVRRIGMVIVRLGAGRARPQDTVDHGVGAIFRKKTGDPVKAGESLATLVARREDGLDELMQEYRNSVTISGRRPRLHPAIQGKVV